MSRIDRKIEAAEEVSVELTELLAAFGRDQGEPAGRSDAMARFLSAAEGWRDARSALKGAFAAPAGNATGLTGGQDK